MMEYLQAEFNRPADGMKVLISGLQLREVDLPDQFDHEIANTQEQMQEVAIAEAEREEQIIIKERETLVAREEVNAAIQAAQGQAESNARILLQFQNDSNPFENLFEAMEIRAID